MTAPRELKDVPIPPDSDPRKRRSIKAATAVASGASCSQMESSHVVADESSMDDKGEKTNPEVRQKFEHQAKHRDKKKHHWKRTKRDERVVAVTTQKSSDGIREKVMRDCEH